MGNAQAAVDVFGAVRERCKDCSESLLGYAIASSRVRDFNSAKTAFKEILNQDPNHPGALYYLALIENYGNKRPDKAIELLTTLVKDTNQRDLDIKRKGNVLLRRLQASEYAKKEKNQSLQQSLENNGGLMPVKDVP